MQHQLSVPSSRPNRSCFKHSFQLAFSKQAHILLSLWRNRATLPLLEIQHLLLIKAMAFQVCKLWDDL